MKMWRVCWLIAALLIPVASHGQAVLQSGAIQPGHAAKWIAKNIIGDAGGVTNGKSGEGLSEALIVNAALGFSMKSGVITGPYQNFSLGFDASGNGLLNLQNFGGAPAKGVNLCINGACNPLTGIGGNVIGPVSATTGDLAAFNNNSGSLLQDSGTPMAAVQKGRMIGYPSANWTSTTTSTTAWVFVTPLGNSAFVCATTTTQCLQEALNYRATNDISLELFCYGGNTGYFNAGSAISTGLIRQDSIIAHGCLINFASNITGDTFKIDTMLDGGRFIWDGQIACNNTAPTTGTSCVTLHPTTIPPQEGSAGLGITNATIEIGGIASGTAAVTPAGSALAFDASSGSIQGNIIHVLEINCNGPGAGASFKNAVELKGATPTTGVFWNPDITIGRWHQCVNGLFENTSNANSYNNNRWKIGVGSPNASTSTGVGYDLTGTFETIDAGAINANEGPYKYGFKIESGASAYTLKIVMTGQSDTLGYVDSGSSDTLDVNQTLSRTAATLFNTPPQIGGGLVSQLPNPGIIGQLDVVHDSSVASAGSVVAGGGSSVVGVGWDGTNWRVWGPPRQQATTDLSDVTQALSWTPVLKFGGATTGITYGTQAGTYNAVGLIRVAQFNLILTSKGSATGAATISGFTVAENNTFNGSCVVSFYANLASITSQPYGNIAASATVADLYQGGAAGNATLQDTNFTNTSQIKGTCTWIGP